MIKYIYNLITEIVSWPAPEVKKQPALRIAASPEAVAERMNEKRISTCPDSAIKEEAKRNPLSAPLD